MVLRRPIARRRVRVTCPSCSAEETLDAAVDIVRHSCPCGTTFDTILAEVHR